MIAAVYARKSTDLPGVVDEQRSVVRQIDQARAYAAGNGDQPRLNYPREHDGARHAVDSSRKSA